MGVKVLALMDKPSSKSFGMVAFVTDFQLEQGFVCIGLAPTSQHRQFISKQEFQSVSSQVLEVSSLQIDMDLKEDSTYVSGWLGNDFARSAEEVSLPVVSLPENFYSVDRGIFWFEDSKRMYARLTGWVDVAARSLFEIRDKKIAREILNLMHWVLPLAQETLAMDWYFAESQNEKNDTLRFQQKILGDRCKDINTLLLQHQAVIKRCAIRM